jgi:hypothetical protein
VFSILGASFRESDANLVDFDANLPFFGSFVRGFGGVGVGSVEVGVGITEVGGEKTGLEIDDAQGCKCWIGGADDAGATSAERIELSHDIGGNAFAGCN